MELMVDPPATAGGTDSGPNMFSVKFTAFRIPSKLRLTVVVEIVYEVPRDEERPGRSLKMFTSPAALS